MKHQSKSVDGSKSDSLSMKSNTKWIPTNEQARILRDLYHNYGVTSPNVEQIQKISNRLRQYGKIEDKNVFYWFSNYKARERRKKRLPMDIPSSNTTAPPPGACSSTTPTLGANAICSSPGLHAVGKIGGSECPGSVLLDNSYKCYFMSCGGGESVLELNKGWLVGLESPEMSHYTRVRKAKIRTLPLFPIHITQEQERVEKEQHQEGKQTEEHGVNLDGGKQQQEDDHCCLELTLNSYHHVPLRST